MRVETSEHHLPEEGRGPASAGAGAPSGSEPQSVRAPTAGNARAVTSVALVFLTFIAFIPVLDNDFVYLDDVANFVNNPDFVGIGWRQFAWSWRAHIIGIYQPLGWQLLSVQSALWGLNPHGYHFMSLVFHAANTVAFFFVTVELLARSRPDIPSSDRTAGAGVAAALFAVHPLRVEAVAWASCQTYLPCALFWLLAVLAYLRANRGDDQRPWRLTICWLMSLAAMLCKATAVSLPIVFLILDVYPLGRLRGDVPGGMLGPAVRKVWLEKLPFLALSVPLRILTVLARRWEYGPDLHGIALSWRFAKAFYGICFYPVKTILPIGLTPIRPTPSRVSLADPAYWPYAAIVIGVSLAVIMLRRRWPAALTVWALYLVLLAPNSGLFPLGRMMVADRYSYMATLGWFVLLGAGIAAVRPQALRQAAVAAGWVVCLLIIPATWGQCLMWRDPEALWVRVADRLAAEVRSAPNSADAHHSLAMVLNALGRRDEALLEVRSAVSIDPGSSDSHCLLASILNEQGGHDEALAAMTEAVRLDPDSFDARYGLAKVMFAVGQLEGAEAEVRQALSAALALSDRNRPSWTDHGCQIEPRRPWLTDSRLCSRHLLAEHHCEPAALRY